ncbi:MAG: SRPBCC family protein [Actinomycetota bacterium]
MGMKFKIQIDAKPDEVFGYASDVARHGEWSTGGLQAQKMSDGPIGKGSTFSTTQKFAGKPASSVVTIRDYEPPSRFKFAAVQGKGTFIHTLTFEPSAEGTLVTREIDRENASPFAILGLVFYPAIRADVMKGLRGLKSKIEGGAR